MYTKRLGFPKAWMPERSNGVDLRSTGRIVRVGSNPTSGKHLFLKSNMRPFLVRVPFQADGDVLITSMPVWLQLEFLQQQENDKNMVDP